MKFVLNLAYFTAFVKIFCTALGGDSEADPTRQCWNDRDKSQREQYLLAFQKME
jgi:hypothetical protein